MEPTDLPLPWSPPVGSKAGFYQHSWWRQAKRRARAPQPPRSSLHRGAERLRWRFPSYARGASLDRQHPRLEARAGQDHVGLLPGLIEALLHLDRFRVTALRAEALSQAEQRPAVVRVLAQVLAVYHLRLRRAPLPEQRGAER